MTICAGQEKILAGFEEQLNLIIGAIKDIQANETVAFCRFFISDAANQQAALEGAIAPLKLPAVSIVQQPPLDGTKIAAWVYACQGKLNDKYNHVWSGNITAASDKSSHDQMLDIFEKYEKSLGNKGLSIAEDCVRTWIFAQNVDVNYAGVVTGRKAYFDSVGLTSKTHYIASTGINGRQADKSALAQMDGYAVGGLQPGQQQYLKGLTHLNPTIEYGVTFERGTAVTYGDRRHIFISGTASIDNKGNVLYVGDIVRQTERMLENVEVLLSEANAGFDDIQQAIVYLRDPADAAAVRDCFARKHSGLNAVFVLAPVCRPQWLIEMECIAVTPAGNPSFEKL